MPVPEPVPVPAINCIALYTYKRADNIFIVNRMRAYKAMCEDRQEYV